MSGRAKKQYFYGLYDSQIDMYVENLGFQSCVSGIAKFCVRHDNKRFLYISSGQFGMRMGKGKKAFYPHKRFWNALRQQCELSQVLFIMIGYENYQPWTMNAKKRKIQEPIPTSLSNWYEHSGLIVVERNDNREWGMMRYFDCQFYTGEKLSGHFAYDSVTKSLRQRVEKILLMSKVDISMNVFSQHVGIENACTAPLLYVIEAMVKGDEIDPYKTKRSLPKFLDKVCEYLEGKGCTDIRGTVPWEELKGKEKQ